MNGKEEKKEEYYKAKKSRARRKRRRSTIKARNSRVRSNLRGVRTCPSLTLLVSFKRQETRNGRLVVDWVKKLQFTRLYWDADS